MMTLYERYKIMKSELGWKNKDVAERIGVSLNAVERKTTEKTKDEDFNKSVKAMISVFEEMKSRARVVFDDPEK